MNKKQLTANQIISSSFLLFSLSFVLLFLIRHVTINEFLMGIKLPWPQTLWILPLVFIIEAVPSWFLSKKLSHVVKKNDQETEEQLSSFSIVQLAGIYIISTTSEEILFRYTIQGWLMQYTNVAVSIIISSILWFLFHPRFIRYWQMCLSIIWIGIVYGVVYAATGSWLLVSISHFLHNFLLGVAGKYLPKDKRE